jgi:Ni/Co efflux regulator RcnB
MLSHIRLEPMMATRSSPSVRGDACHLAAAVLFAFLAAGPAAAASGKAKPAEPAAEAVPPGGQASYGVKLGAFFTEQHRQATRKYFAQNYAKGKECPPGMERGRNGCAPPVPGRYWAVGQPLNKAVAEYPLPQAVIARLPPAPEGYRYALVGDDIVLMASGTKLVVDIIENVLG